MAIQFFDTIPKDQFHFGIFDFDNGIVDTESVFAQFDRDLLNEVIRLAKKDPLLTAADVRPLAGNSGSEKLKIIAKRYGFDPMPYLDGFNEKRNRLRTNLFQYKPAPLAQGLQALLDHLESRRALATNKKAFKLEPDMKAMGIENMFDVIVTSDGLNKKPAPDVIIEAMKQLNAAPEETVYFGDNVSDIEAAIKAGVYAFGFIIEGLDNEGARIQAMRDAGAHAVLDDYQDVIRYIK